MYFKFTNFWKCTFSICIFMIFAMHAKADDTTCRAFFTFVESGFGEIIFTNKSKCNSGQPVKIYWNFGDGSPLDSNENPVHKFTKAGIYPVQVRLIGKSDSTIRFYSRKVSIKGLCNYEFDIKNKDREITINLPIIDNDVFEFDFGDGSKEYTTKNKLQYTHTYAAAGNYTVSLYAVTGYNCQDTVRKLITVTDPVYCHAGFQLSAENDPYRTIHAESDLEYFAGKDSSYYFWDYGDGGKDSGIGLYKTSHSYAADGTYTMSLSISNAAHNCSDYSTQNVIVSRNIQTADISGSVTYLDSVTNVYFSVDTAIVYLIQYNELDSTLTAIDTMLTYIDTGKIADYFFTGLKPGKYLIKAALGNNSKHIKYLMPTYYYGALKWSDADTITFTSATGESIPNLEIVLKKGSNTSGRGFIGGKVVAGANKKEGDPLENIQVLLFNANTSAVVAHTYSDKSGRYSFSNLAFGKYEIYTEIIGLKTASAFVTLTETDSAFKNVMVRVSSDGIDTEVLTGIKNAELNNMNIQVYPSPAINTLHINFEAAKPQTIVSEIFSIDGRSLLHGKYHASAGSQSIDLNIASLPKGTYILLLKNTSSAEVARYKFVKL